MLLIGGAFLLLGLCVYGQNLFHTFVLWDDNTLILGNPDTKGFSLRTIVNAFSTFDPELYIPFTLLSYQLNYALAGDSSWIYHLTNLLLHIANAILVWRVLAKLTGNDAASIIGGLLFLVHPLNTEAVAWASARKDQLSTAFFLGSLLTWLRYRESEKNSVLYLSIGLFLCALLSKVMVVTLPAIVLLIAWWKKEDWNKETWRAFIPSAVLSVIFVGIALLGKREILASTTPLQTILMASRSTVFYIEKFFVPLNLSVLYPYEGTIGLHEPIFWICSLITILITALCLAMLRRSRTPLFVWAFFLLTLAPTFTNFSKGGFFYIASDRYAYIPMIGLLCGVVSFLTIKRGKLSQRAIFSVLCIFSVLSFFQTRTWNDSVTLFEHALATAPHSVPAHINLAVILRKEGKLDEALKRLQEANAIHETPAANAVIASVYLQQNKPEEALVLCLKVQRVDPRNPEGPYCKALSFAAAHDEKNARLAYEETLLLEPRHVGALNNLAAMALEDGDTAKAKTLYLQAQDVAPTFSDIPYNLGIIAQKEGNLLQTIAYIERAAYLEHDEKLETLEKLLELAAQANDKTLTISVAKRILKLKPDHAVAQKLLEALQ